MPVTIRSNLWRSADLALNGNLVSYLRESRSNGDTYEQIAREISAKGVIVSPGTARDWCIRLDAHELTKAAAAS